MCYVIADGTVKFYLSLYCWGYGLLRCYLVMHVFDGVLAVFSSLFTRHRYPPGGKLFAVLVFVAGLSLRWISDRLSITHASRESVRLWMHKFSRLYSPSKRVRRLVAVDEAVVEVNGYRCHLWTAIDVDSEKALAVYVSRGITPRPHE